MKQILNLFWILGISLLTCCMSTDIPGVSDQTTRVVHKIEVGGMLLGPSVGIRGTRPKQYDNFVELAKIATLEELVELTYYRNNVVRCYALIALSDRPEVDPEPFVNRYLQDLSWVKVQHGCIIKTITVAEFVEASPELFIR